MLAKTIYTRLNNYVGPNSSSIELLKESDMSRFGAFALCFRSMINYPVKSYGKIKKQYRIEVWELTTNGPQCIQTYHFDTKAECLKRFNQGELI